MALSSHEEIVKVLSELQNVGLPFAFLFVFFLLTRECYNCYYTATTTTAV